MGYRPNRECRVKRQADLIREFFALLAPGFIQEGELPAVKLEGVEERHDEIARVEVL